MYVVVKGIQSRRHLFYQFEAYYTKTANAYAKYAMVAYERQKNALIGATDAVQLTTLNLPDKPRLATNPVNLDSEEDVITTPQMRD